MRAELLAARNDLSSAETRSPANTRRTPRSPPPARELVAGGDALAGQLADAAKAMRPSCSEELATTQAAPRDGESPEPASSRSSCEPADGATGHRVLHAAARGARPGHAARLIDGDRFIFPADIAFEPARPG